MGHRARASGESAQSGIRNRGVPGAAAAIKPPAPPYSFNSTSGMWSETFGGVK